MVLFDFAGVDFAVSLAAYADDVSERPRAYLLDEVVVLLDLLLHALHQL